MPWLAITWNNDRLLLLTAKGTGASLAFDRAISVELDRGSDSLIREKIRETVLKERLGRMDAIIVLPRGDVEIRPMSFPYVPVEELPALVRFQAAREFNGYDPVSPLDFLLLHERSAAASQSTATVPVLGRRVLATAIPSSQLQKWNELCESCQLKLRRLVLSPCETASLWRQSESFNESATDLLVELDSEEASQTVVCRGQPIFMRSPRLMSGSFVEDAGGISGIMRDAGDSGDSETLPSLIAELKRTRFAVRNETPPVTIESIILCGTGEEHAKAAALIEKAMDSPVTLFDPWTKRARTGELRAGPPPFAEQFAPLLGAILAAANNRPGDLDLLNPKRKPEILARRRIAMTAAVVAVVLVVAAIAFGFYRRAVLQRELQQLKEHIGTLQKEADLVGKQREQLTAVEQWSEKRVNWFEQLDWLSTRLPPARDVKLTSLNVSVLPGTGVGGEIAKMDIKGLARNNEVIAPMEAGLRDAAHDVQSGQKRADTADPRYGFYFDLIVYVKEPDKNTAPKPASKPIVPPIAGPEGEPQAVPPETIEAEYTENN
ncbi:MAG TPA: hypothetical protein DEB39_08865 [Planctomycetaceae bacterium]|nr:hypothetical protein [Planctomycetaceae bacterium]